MIDLAGAVACVTGGARGIGRATAEALVQRGSTVWIGDVDADEADVKAGTCWDPEQYAKLLR